MPPTSENMLVETWLLAWWLFGEWYLSMMPTLLPELYDPMGHGLRRSGGLAERDDLRLK
jgi:hypothetical protein